MTDEDLGAPPGAPGLGPTWSAGNKDMVGCALGSSRLWFTVGGGIINEVYYPRVDTPQIRDLGFIVADDQGFWTEVKRLDSHHIETAGAGVPAVSIVHRHPRFELRLRAVCCPQRDVLLIDVQLEGEAGLRPYALLAPHLGGTGHRNQAAVSRYHSRRMLWAQQGPFSLALAAVDSAHRDAWGRASAGYVGFSDGWQDFARNGRMSWEHPAAGPGNVALLGELPTHAVLGLGFGSSEQSAATLAVSALMEPFEQTWSEQIRAWRLWHTNRATASPSSARLPPDLIGHLATSAMVLKVHQDKIYPGSMVAALSIPWGNHRDELGGYHLVWPRDLAECGSALLELGSPEEPRQILQYLLATQHSDGHWNQNQWLGGKEFWKGVQLDEAAFPVLLAAALAERDELRGMQVADMIQRALGFVVTTGPSTPQDRWEEDAGLNAFTLAVCISALVCGAEFLQEPARAFALSMADFWNSRIEDWLVARNTAFGQNLGVSSYYARAMPEQILRDPAAAGLPVPIRNRSDGANTPASDQISTDFLQLVRFGLRDADDPIVLDTVRMVDALLRLELNGHAYWYRYCQDGYGEHEDGAPFDGTGQGRPWPLLAGERGHYALCRGEDPLPYLRAMVACTSPGGMIPEQVWDRDDLPRRLLRRGRPTGSATPLAWAHAEFVKLAYSFELGYPVDRPMAVWRRYRGRRSDPTVCYWTESAPIATVAAHSALQICLTGPGRVRAGIEGQPMGAERITRDTTLGLHVAELGLPGLTAGQVIHFQTRLDGSSDWDERIHEVRVTGT